MPVWLARTILVIFSIGGGGVAAFEVVMGVELESTFWMTSLIFNLGLFNFE